MEMVFGVVAGAAAAAGGEGGLVAEALSGGEEGRGVGGGDGEAEIFVADEAGGEIAGGPGEEEGAGGAEVAEDLGREEEGLGGIGKQGEEDRAAGEDLGHLVEVLIGKQQEIGELPGLLLGGQPIGPGALGEDDDADLGVAAGALREVEEELGVLRER